MVGRSGILEEIERRRVEALMPRRSWLALVDWVLRRTLMLIDGMID